MDPYKCLACGGAVDKKGFCQNCGALAGDTKQPGPPPADSVRSSIAGSIEAFCAVSKAIAKQNKPHVGSRLQNIDAELASIPPEKKATALRYLVSVFAYKANSTMWRTAIFEWRNRLVKEGL
jgi:hypothetical protein